MINRIKKQYFACYISRKQVFEENQGVYVLIPGGLFNTMARSLDFAPVLSIESTGAALGMTGGYD